MDPAAGFVTAEMLDGFEASAGQIALSLVLMMCLVATFGLSGAALGSLLGAAVFFAASLLTRPVPLRQSLPWSDPVTVLILGAWAAVLTRSFVARMSEDQEILPPRAGFFGLVVPAWITISALRAIAATIETGSLSWGAMLGCGLASLLFGGLIFASALLCAGARPPAFVRAGLPAAFVTACATVALTGLLS
ncbi:hypothetical protein [Alsobacter sp. SYSU BS001988]